MPSIGRLAAAFVAVVAVACGHVALATEASAQSLESSPPIYRFYGGAGVNGVHHTGYVPDTAFSSEIYRAGAKAFAGYRVNDWVSFETAYHYLGEGRFDEGLAVESRERSQSVFGTVLVFSPAVFERVLPTRAFLRGGFGYKAIRHVSAVAAFDEGVVSWVVGTGFEFELTSRLFARLEYEFVSRGIGGTRHAINVMHTPLSVSVGVRF